MDRAKKAWKKTRVYVRSDGHSLKCPKCGSARHEVKETRAHAGAIYRKRKCKACKEPFITHEYAITTDLGFWRYLGTLGALETQEIQYGRAKHNKEDAV